MNDDYLWDKTGEPDPEVERLEQLLGRFRQDKPTPTFPAAEPAPRWVWFFPLISRLAAAAVIALAVATSGWYALRWSRPAWDVERVAGAPRIGSAELQATGRLAVGEWLETDNISRAKINVGAIGEVEVEPNTRVRLLQARPTEHRLALDRGTMHARIWAPPRLFYVNTPFAVAVDLGCTYTLQVDASGAGLLRVTFGWVAFEQTVGATKLESFVPAGAMCLTWPGAVPGTPYFEDASPSFSKALALFDFGISGNATRTSPDGRVTIETPAQVRVEALRTVLAEARQKDGLTLWHLLARTSGPERGQVYDRLAQLVPPPAGVTREGILRGDPEMQRRMRDLWWDALGLRDASWWRMWKGPVPAR